MDPSRPANENRKPIIVFINEKMTICIWKPKYEYKILLSCFFAHEHLSAAILMQKD